MWHLQAQEKVILEVLHMYDALFFLLRQVLAAHLLRQGTMQLGHYLKVRT